MILKGVYSIEDSPDVHLIEMMFEQAPENVDVGQITQEVTGISKDSWQAPWDEWYLDDSGENVVSERFTVPEGRSTTRLVFYFHYLNLAKPLLTEFGPLILPKPTILPDRLKRIITYEPPD